MWPNSSKSSASFAFWDFSSRRFWNFTFSWFGAPFWPSANEAGVDLCRFCPLAARLSAAEIALGELSGAAEKRDVMQPAARSPNNNINNEYARGHLTVRRMSQFFRPASRPAPWASTNLWLININRPYRFINDKQIYVARELSAHGTRCAPFLPVGPERRTTRVINFPSRAHDFPNCLLLILVCPAFKLSVLCWGRPFDL